MFNEEDKSGVYILPYKQEIKPWQQNKSDEAVL